MENDTIAAIASGLSNSGISIVRLSGDDAAQIADRVFRAVSGEKVTQMKSFTIHYGFIYEDKECIDEVLLMYMKAPRTYTRENIVEIDCHGGIVVTKKILNLLIKNGARPAEPGEFTKRAFINGRIDLSQAEAVIDIINAKSNLALKNSICQLKGTLQQRIHELREKVLEDVAFIEAALDDPEHISIEGFTEILKTHVNKELEEIKSMIASADNGRIIKEGVRTAIIGKPNAGKSSLLNVLLGEERAIVTDIAGTTRDTLEESIQLDGISLNIIDTAGIRETDDIIEKMGVDRALSVIKDADLVLYVMDSLNEIDDNDKRIIEYIKDRKSICLLNKTDKTGKVSVRDAEKITGRKVISFSTKELTGLEELEKEINNMFFSGELSFNDEIYITNIRQKKELQNAYDSLMRVSKSIEAKMPEDFFSIDMMSAYEELGRITGETVEDDLANEIFSKFCMGK